MTNRREGGDTSCRGRSREALGLHLEELETVRAAPELLGAPTIGGGSARPGGGGGEIHRSHTYMPSQPYEIAKNGKKTGSFAHVLAYKSPKTPFFAQKYLTRYTRETFFEKYVNFQNHYLSHCGVISVQSFGSHLRPQPHGLGLRLIFNKVYDRFDCESFCSAKPQRFIWRWNSQTPQLN